MKKQAIKQGTAELIFLRNQKAHFKKEIYETLNLIPLSKQMINKYLFISEPIISEILKELLNENLIFDMKKNQCFVTNIDQNFYGTAKTITFIKRFQNG